MRVECLGNLQFKNNIEAGRLILGYRLFNRQVVGSSPTSLPYFYMETVAQWQSSSHIAKLIRLFQITITIRVEEFGLSHLIYR